MDRKITIAIILTFVIVSIWLIVLTVLLSKLLTKTSSENPRESNSSFLNSSALAEQHHVKQIAENKKKIEKIVEELFVIESLMKKHKINN